MIHTLHQEKGYEIASLCALSGIPRSSYYKWLHREESASEKENTLLLEEIIRLYSEVKGIYGYRRMTLNGEALDHELLQTLGSPASELRCNGGLDAIAQGDDHVEVIVIYGIGFLVCGSCSDFPNNCALL